MTSILTVTRHQRPESPQPAHAVQSQRPRLDGWPPTTHAMHISPLRRDGRPHILPVISFFMKTHVPKRDGGTREQGSCRSYPDKEGRNNMVEDLEDDEGLMVTMAVMYPSLHQGSAHVLNKPEPGRAEPSLAVDFVLGQNSDHNHHFLTVYFLF